MEEANEALPFQASAPVAFQARRTPQQAGAQPPPLPLLPAATAPAAEGSEPQGSQPLCNPPISTLPQMDEGLTPLQMVAELAAEGNPPGQRVSYILSIPAVAADCSLEEARGLLLPLISQLVFDDHPDIKQATAEVLGPLGALPRVGDAGLGQLGC